VSGARWAGTLQCRGGRAKVDEAVLSVAEGWPTRAAVRVQYAEDPYTREPWAGIGGLGRTGDRVRHVACMDGEDHFLAGDIVLEPVAPELVQLPPRKTVREGRRVKIDASVPALDAPYLARCEAATDLVWSPDGWHVGRVRCENPEAVLERVILRAR
jgi:hypothetical protein